VASLGTNLLAHRARARGRWSWHWGPARDRPALGEPRPRQCGGRLSRWRQCRVIAAKWPSSASGSPPTKLLMRPQRAVPRTSAGPPRLQGPGPRPTAAESDLNPYSMPQDPGCLPRVDAPCQKGVMMCGCGPGSWAQAHLSRNGVSCRRQGRNPAPAYGSGMNGGFGRSAIRAWPGE